MGIYTFKHVLGARCSTPFCHRRTNKSGEGELCVLPKGKCKYTDYIEGKYTEGLVDDVYQLEAEG